MATQKDDVCLGCGHRISRHREYARGGVNRFGCRLVCTVDGCMRWNDCVVQVPKPVKPAASRGDR